MSNTGRNKKLASFNCDTELWAAFISRCQQGGTTATAVLTRFIELYLDGQLDNLNAHLGKAQITFSDEQWERVKNWVDEYLDKHNQGLSQDLPAQIMTLSQKMEDLEHRLLDVSAISSPSASNRAKKPTKEPEVWFIPQRAKHLGLTVNANQIIHIQLLASEYYKERHGKLPPQELLRNTQTFAYPKNDVDLLDHAIKKVLARKS